VKRSSTYFGIALIAALSLSGCSAIQSVTSKAYAAGLVSGQGYAGLKESTDHLQSWIPVEDGSESEPLLQGDENTVRTYCTSVWPVVGVSSGLENTDANERDFVSGCLDGAGF